MVLLDVNILVYAHRQDSQRHHERLTWLEELINSNQAYGLSDLVLSRFICVVPHLKTLTPLTPMNAALAFAHELRQQPNCTIMAPGPRHWNIFCRLCNSADIKGNLVPDAFLAALAIKSASEWVTADHDYHRFPGLRVRHPLNW